MHTYIHTYTPFIHVFRHQLDALADISTACMTLMIMLLSFDSTQFFAGVSPCMYTHTHEHACVPFAVNMHFVEVTPCMHAFARAAVHVHLVAASSRVFVAVSSRVTPHRRRSLRTHGQRTCMRYAQHAHGSNTCQPTRSCRMLPRHGPCISSCGRSSSLFSSFWYVRARVHSRFVCGCVYACRVQARDACLLAMSQRYCIAYTVGLYMCMHVHTRVHLADRRSDLCARVRACHVQAYMHTYTRTYMHACVHACMHFICRHVMYGLVVMCFSFVY